MIFIGEDLESKITVAMIKNIAMSETEWK